MSNTSESTARRNRIFAEHLQGMVRFATVSKPLPEEDTMDGAPFEGLHAYLEASYPLVHKTFSKELVGRYGLLYTWKGKDGAHKEPLLLMAHQDVVPEGDWSLWKYPPYSGEIAEGYVWGRGSSDSKSNIQAYMDALELLIQEGFTPEYDLYLAFGYNEEVGGMGSSAESIVRLLQARGVKPGCIFDEGGGIYTDQDGNMRAEVCVCEKGYVDIELSKTSKGGHASIPPAHSALGDVCRAVCQIEAHQPEQKLIPCIAEYLPAIAHTYPGELGRLLAEPEKNWEQLKTLLAQDEQLNALTRTTATPTVAVGSAQSNVLPERAAAVLNCRLLPGETLEGLLAYFRETLSIEGVEIRCTQGGDPPPEQSSDTEAFRLIRRILRQRYPNITVTPAMMLGATDSRFYCGICEKKSVYRFSALRRDDALWGNEHKANERVPVDILADNVAFYMQFLQEYGKMEG